MNNTFDDSEFEIIRGEIDGKKKYCRIPIRSKVAEMMQDDGIYELNAESILAMPHERAAATIDALVNDWMYWLRRANELFIRLEATNTGNEELNE